MRSSHDTSILKELAEVLSKQMLLQFGSQIDSSNRLYIVRIPLPKCIHIGGRLAFADEAESYYAVVSAAQTRGISPPERSLA